MNARSIWGRRLLWIVGAGVGAVLLVTFASALAGSLAIAEQPGRSIGVPAVSVQPSGASTSVATTPTPTPSTEPTAPTTTPEVVPAQDPVVVDDHGGDRPGHDDDSSGGSSGSSGSDGSGSGGSEG